MMEVGEEEKQMYEGRWKFFFLQTYLASARRIHLQLACQLWKPQAKDKNTEELETVICI